MNKKDMTFAEVCVLARTASNRAEEWYAKKHSREPDTLKLYGVPRGGVYAALAMLPYGPFELTDWAADAHVIVDDIVDSGATLARYREAFPDKPFVALVNKQDARKPFEGVWVSFPWERNETAQDETIEDNITRLLQFVGEDPARGGLLETPARVARAWKHWCGGYGKDPAAVLKVFHDGAEQHDQMIAVCDIPFYSHCEHHLAPIFGTATVAYIPNGRIVGLSKLSRLVDIYARRLQVQERLTDQIVDSLNVHLSPLGAGVYIRARHLCMESRGVCQQGHHTVTTALRGCMQSGDAKSEFLRLCYGA